MDTPESLKPRPTLVRVAATVFYLAGIVAIVGWSLPEAGLPGYRAELAMRLPDTGIPDTTGVRSTPAQVMGSARRRVTCANCGVIESVRRIDSREEIVGGCTVGDIAGTRIHGILVEGVQHRDSATLAETVAAVLVGEQGARKVRVTTRHQIVVRFRDGSRHVFNEETPRTLREGDRIQVIAGATGANG